MYNTITIGGANKIEVDYESKKMKGRNRLSWFIWTHKLSRSTKLKNLAALDELIL